MGDHTLTVLHLIDTGGPGGAETVFASVVTGLDPGRWRSLPVVPVRDWLHAELVERGEEPVLLASSRGFDLGFLRRLDALVVREGVELIHAHLLGSAVYGSLVAARRGLPVVCTFHGPPDIPDRGGLLPLKRRIISRRRNRIVFVSESLRERILARHPLPARRTAVVHNGIEAPEPAAALSRADLGAEPDDLLVGAIGNIRPAKDYPTLLRATGEARRQGIPVRVVVAGQGSGPLMEELLRLRAALGLDDAVEFLGFRDDVGAILESVDVVASSSSKEGFSLTVVEALWRARPVVATRSGGPEEILRDGRTGLLVPPGDPAALAEALERVHLDPEEARRRARAGAEDVRSRFSRERMLRDYQEIYRELVEAA